MSNAPTVQVNNQYAHIGMQVVAEQVFFGGKEAAQPEREALRGQVSQRFGEALERGELGLNASMEIGAALERLLGPRGKWLETPGCRLASVEVKDDDRDDLRLPLELLRPPRPPAGAMLMSALTAAQPMIRHPPVPLTTRRLGTLGCRAEFHAMSAAPSVQVNNQYAPQHRDAGRRRPGVVRRQRASPPEREALRGQVSQRFAEAVGHGEVSLDGSFEIGAALQRMLVPRGKWPDTLGCRLVCVEVDDDDRDDLRLPLKLLRPPTDAQPVLVRCALATTEREPERPSS